MLAKANIHIDMIVQNTNRANVNDISFTVNADDLQDAVTVAQQFAFAEAQKVEFDKGVEAVYHRNGHCRKPRYRQPALRNAVQERRQYPDHLDVRNQDVDAHRQGSRAGRAMVKVHEAFELDR